jgi:transposase
VIQRPFDTHRYKARNLVERFFCRIKQFRRIATRYEKLALSFSSFVALTASIIWLA